MDKRCYNYNAGPAVLPEEVIKQIEKDLWNYKGSGMSVMEMSHRSKEFLKIMEDTRGKIRSLLGVPQEYDVLLLQGGARLIFSMLPLNFYVSGKPIDMIHTGEWTKQAISEIKPCGELRMAADMSSGNFSALPSKAEIKLNPDASYVHICSNNTIEGTQWHDFPDTGKVPVVLDVTSDIFSRPMDVSRFGAIVGSAQKNAGIAGITIVIIRKDWAERANEKIPPMLQFKSHIKADSLLNTAPTFPIYVTGLVLEWVERQGGLKVMEKISREKSKLIYDVLDSGDFYTTPVKKEHRSNMNVVWRVRGGNDALEEKFLKEAKELGFVGLAGHRSVGGIRASIYNAQPMQSVELLADFMKKFASKNK